MRKESLQIYKALARTLAASDLKVEKSEDNVKVSLPNVGSALGDFVYLSDEEQIKEGYPLGLNAYGEKVANDLYDEIEELDYIFYITDVYVEPDARGKGYGKMLLDKLEKEAKKESIDAIMGNASPHGSGIERVSFGTLKNFYENAGYKFLYTYQNKNGLFIKS